MTAIPLTLRPGLPNLGSAFLDARISVFRELDPKLGATAFLELDGDEMVARALAPVKPEKQIVAAEYRGAGEAGAVQAGADAFQVRP